jgi:hypothetical protein
MSRSSSSPRRLLVAVAVVSSIAVPTTAAASPAGRLSHHPSITSLRVSPGTVAHSGGSAEVTAVVHHAISCKVSSSPSLPGLPTTHSCSSGHLTLRLHVHAAPTASARHFTLTLTAVDGSHHVRKTTALTEAAAPPAPTVTGFAVSPTQIASAGGQIHATATVKHATTCTLSASPAISGLPASLPCSSPSFSRAVDLPADTGSTPKSYLFTLTAHGTGGVATAGNHPMATVATSGPTPITTTTSDIASLPTGANTGDTENADLVSVACPTAARCVSVGYYYAAPVSPQTVNESGLIETLSGTTWTASAAPTPSDIDTDESVVTLSSVSCSSATDCTAVGYYLANNSAEEPYVATLAGSSWTWQPASVPTDGPNRLGGQLLSVSCPASGGCIAVGKFQPPADIADALIEQPSVGGWAGSEAPLPSNADPEESNGTEIQDILYDVSCTSATNCAAVGEYTVGSGPTLSTEGFADTLTNSGWAATQLAPTDEGGYDKAVSCGGDICVGTGEYNSSNSEIQTEAAGVWDPSDALVAPQPTTFAGTELYATDCTSDSSCVLVGDAYYPSSGTYSLIDTGSGTSYSDLAAPVPNNAKTSTPRSALSAVSCAAPGSCMAVGYYSGTDVNSLYYDSLLETETTTQGTSTWTPSEAPIPTGSDNPGTLSAVSCVASWGCVSIGVISPTGSNAAGEIVTAPL